MDRPPDHPAADRRLLDRFLTERDEGAFAELVRRHGPAVWGVCRRRLARAHDAEDAFQATFLVLVRRAARLDARTPLGPWLLRVAGLTVRNVVRGNRRRAAVLGPLDHDVPAPTTAPSPDRLDLHTALCGLSEPERATVELCHLRGVSRRDAAVQLGCPEGTLSARLNRAVARLRARLAAGAAGVALPSGLADATARAATVFSFSIPTHAGPSPAVVGLTDGVLRMFWVKKLTAATAVVLAGTGLLVGGSLLALDPPPAPVAAAQPPAPDDVARRLDDRLRDLERQKAALDDQIQKAAAERAKLVEYKKVFDAASGLRGIIAVAVTEGGKGVGWVKPPYTVREVIGGKVGEVQCFELDVLELHLTRAFRDPSGPKAFRLEADQNFSHDQVHKVLGSAARAGFTKARFVLPEAPLIVSFEDWKTRKGEKVERGQKERDIDLVPYAPPKAP